MSPISHLKEFCLLSPLLCASNDPETILNLNSVKPIAGKHRLLHFEVDDRATDYETEYKRLKNNDKHFVNYHTVWMIVQIQCLPKRK